VDRAMDVCDAALAELRPAVADRRYDDDTALLAIVTHAVGETPRPADEDPGLVSLDLPADTESPSRARETVASVLTSWGLASLIDAAVLLVSEIVTNGVRHAGTGMRLTIQRRGESRLRIAVTDAAPEVALRPRQSPEDAEGGRGLFLVEHLSAGWGSVADENGKTVWFELVT